MAWDEIKKNSRKHLKLPSNGAFFSDFKHLYKYTFSQQNRAIVELDPQQPLYYMKNLILLKKC